MLSLIGGVYLQIFTMTLIIATNPVVPGKLGFRGESQYYCVLGIMSYKSLLLPLFWRRLQKFTIRRPLKLIEGLPGWMAGLSHIVSELRKKSDSGFHSALLAHPIFLDSDYSLVQNN